MYSYEELVGIIAELRSDHGCPWDKAQTHESLIPCLRDECEEVVQAIEKKDGENLCEELGDVLLQVLMHAQIAKEDDEWSVLPVFRPIPTDRQLQTPAPDARCRSPAPAPDSALW